jgi:hypothetical protein
MGSFVLGFSVTRGPRGMPVCLAILCPQLRLSEFVVSPGCAWFCFFFSFVFFVLFLLCVPVDVTTFFACSNLRALVLSDCRLQFFLSSCRCNLSLSLPDSNLTMSKSDTVSMHAKGSVLDSVHLKFFTDPSGFH